MVFKCHGGWASVETQDSIVQLVMQDVLSILRDKAALGLSTGTSLADFTDKNGSYGATVEYVSTG